MYSDIISEIYNGFYSMSDKSNRNRSLNSIGWNSSFTGKPYTIEEMTEWRDDTLEVIKSFKPSKILEIACGTGMMLFGLIEDAKKYTGIDIAEEGIKYIKANLTHEESTKTELYVMSAENIETLQENDYDIAFINSATQYMGPADEFTECVRKMTDKVKKDGIVFLGDMKSAIFRDEFYRTCILHSGKTENINEQIAIKRKRDFEFYISGEYLRLLKDSIPRIKDVKLVLKRGSFPTEMNLFRFGAILYLDKAQNNDFNDIECSNMKLNDIIDSVKENGASRIKLCNIKNLLLEEILDLKNESISLYINDILSEAEKIGYKGFAVPHDNDVSLYFDVELIRTGV